MTSAPLIMLVALASIAAPGSPAPTVDAPAAVSGETGNQVAERIRTRLENRGPSSDLDAPGDREASPGEGDPLFASGTAAEPGPVLHALEALPVFYEQRGFRPAWCDTTGAPAGVDELVAMIRSSGAQGLRPADYHLVSIETLSAGCTLAREARDSRRLTGLLADLDLLLTDAYMTLGSHLLAGRINPESIDAEWRANRRGARFSGILAAAVRGGRIAESLQGLAPRQPEYARLVAALAEYRAIEGGGGWPTVTAGSTLKLGAEGAEVGTLRERLLVTGDLATGAAQPAAGAPDFDETLAAGVRRFQHRHGLDVDGVVGPATLRALQVTVADRIRQIEINLERWRWLPDELGSRHVRVNIAGFGLQVYDGAKVALEMKAIVGKSYRRTPVFSDAITYLVLNPSWVVPDELARADVLPQLVKDPRYLERHGIAVYRGWGAGEQRIDGAAVDWRTISAERLPYRFVQAPGPTNPLGKIKFMFPNKFNVYLHDTAAPRLFDRSVRSFSSGCIRVARPLELAEFLLRGSTEWPRAALEKAIASGAERTVRLPEPVPVHLLYFTAWVDDEGAVHFRDDIYGRDGRLEDALRERAT